VWFTKPPLQELARYGRSPNFGIFTEKLSNRSCNRCCREVFRELMEERREEKRAEDERR
jgi:hypothetical protein